MPVSPATPVGLFSKASSQVITVLGKTTSTFCGIRIVSLFTCTQPPEVLQAAGVGADGVGVGVATGVLTPAVVSSVTPTTGSHRASTEAYSMKPSVSKPTGMVWKAGIVAGVGGVVGLGHWACAAVTAKISSRLTTATLKIFITCWFTLIVKLLPSICYFPWVSTAFSRRELSHSYCWLRRPQKCGGTVKI